MEPVRCHFATSVGQSNIASVLREIEHKAQCMFPPVPPPLDVLDPRVAYGLITHWHRPCEAMFEALAQRHPVELVKLIDSNKLPPAELTFAAEALGCISDGELVRRTLIRLLDHSSAVVREGALYGLQWHLDNQVRTIIANMATSDSSPGVRSSAQDLIG